MNNYPLKGSVTVINHWGSKTSNDAQCIFYDIFKMDSAEKGNFFLFKTFIFCRYFFIKFIFPISPVKSFPVLAKP